MHTNYKKLLVTPLRFATPDIPLATPDMYTLSTPDMYTLATPDIYTLATPDMYTLSTPDMYTLATPALTRFVPFASATKDR